VIGIEIDPRALEGRFKVSEKQILYATVNAITRAMKDAQKREQANARAKLHLRGGAGEQLIMRSVAKISQFPSAKKGIIFGEFGLDQPKPRMLLTGLELGGQKTPFMGSRVAVPLTGSSARPTIEDTVPGNLRLTALQLQPPLSHAQRQQRKSIKGGTRKETAALRKNFTRAAGVNSVWKGKERTYMIPAIGVFQRSGSGTGSTSRLIYKFVPRPNLRPMLGFTDLATSVGGELLARYMNEEIAKSVAHNQARGS